MRQRYGQVDLGLNFGTICADPTPNAIIRLQRLRDNNWATCTYPDGNNVVSTDYWSNALFDTRDTLALPARGMLVNVHYAHSESWFGGQFDYSLFEALAMQAFSVRGGDSLALPLVAAMRRAASCRPRTCSSSAEYAVPDCGPESCAARAMDGRHRCGWRLADIQPLFGQALYAEPATGPQMRGRVDGCRPTRCTALPDARGRTGRAVLFSIGWVNDGSWQLQFSFGRPVPEGSCSTTAVS
jgi:hypothetical protein